MPRDPGLTKHDPFSLLAPSRSPGALGIKDAADPNTPAIPGPTPGPAGVGPDRSSQLVRQHESRSALAFLANHRRVNDSLVQSVMLDSCATLKVDTTPKKEKKVLPLNKHTFVDVWSVAEALVYRGRAIKKDTDGGYDTYHPPTNEFWTGYDKKHPNAPGLGRDSLLDAVADPDPHLYSATDAEMRKAYLLTSGCELLKDFHRATSLQNALDPASRRDLENLLKKYGVPSLEGLRAKSATAICVEKVPGRDFQHQLNDWKNVKRWSGILGLDQIQTSGPYKGFYYPKRAVDWILPQIHPWLVQTPEINDHFGTKHGKGNTMFGNAAVAIINGRVPKLAFAMIGEGGPRGDLGECSDALLQDLTNGSLAEADYIFITFPGTGHTRERSPEEIKKFAKSAFEGWTVDGRSGINVVKDLFPLLETYRQAEDEYRIHCPGDIIMPGKSFG